jgi:hypothetical protein
MADAGVPENFIPKVLNHVEPVRHAATLQPACLSRRAARGTRKVGSLP